MWIRLKWLVNVLCVQAESQIAEGLKDWDPSKDPNAVVRHSWLTLLAQVM